LRNALGQYRRHGVLLGLFAATFATGLILGSAISLIMAPAEQRRADLVPLERSEPPQQAAETQPASPPLPAPVIDVAIEELPPLAVPQALRAPLEVEHPTDFTGEEEPLAAEAEPAPPEPEIEAPREEVIATAPAGSEDTPAPAAPRLVFNAPEAAAPAPTPQVQPQHQVAEEDAEAPGVLRLAAEPAWQRNAVQLAGLPSGPAVAVVIDDVGLNRPGANRSIALPPPVTLAMMTYADGLPDLARRARAAGHELMVHMPMQPIDAEYNAGIKVLTVGLEPDQLQERIEWGLGRFEGFVGINNHMGSRFTTNAPGMATVMAELKRRGLMFLDSRTVGHSLGVDAARQAGVPVVARDIFIDHEQESGYIRGQLQALETLARQRGYAVGIGHPHVATLAELERWIPEARARGVTFVPVSAILDLQERSLAAHAGAAHSGVN
jgi:hypothetical protein